MPYRSNSSMFILPGKEEDDNQDDEKKDKDSKSKAAKKGSGKKKKDLKSMKTFELTAQQKIEKMRQELYDERAKIMYQNMWPEPEKRMLVSDSFAPPQKPAAKKFPRRRLPREGYHSQ